MNINYRIIQNILINKNYQLLQFSFFVKFIYMHEISEYYRYINLCNWKSDTFVYLYFTLSTLF